MSDNEITKDEKYIEVDLFSLGNKQKHMTTVLRAIN